MDYISTSSSKQHVEQYFSTGDLRKLIWFRWWLCICYWYKSSSFSAVERRGGGSNWCRWCKGSSTDVAFRERTFGSQEMVVYWLSCPTCPLPPVSSWLLLPSVGWWYPKVCYLDAVDGVDGCDAQVVSALDMYNILDDLCRLYFVKVVQKVRVLYGYLVTGNNLELYISRSFSVWTCQISSWRSFWCIWLGQW